MAISIDQKGVALEFKLFGLDNNFKDLLLSGRVGFQSINGQQEVRRLNLAPGDSYQYTSIGGEGHPTMLIVRAEPRAPGKGVLVAEMVYQQPYSDLTAYDPSTGRAGGANNYGSSSPADADAYFEIDKLFVWTGIFRTLELTNPSTNPSSVQVAIIEG